MTEKQLTGYPSIDKPWLKYYSEEAIQSSLPNGTIFEHVYEKNKDNLDRICMNYYGRNVTYRGFFEKVYAVASALSAYGVYENDIVTIVMFNSPESIYTLFAASKIGAVANAIYPTGTAQEIIDSINNTKSKFVVTLDIFQDKLLEILDDTEVSTVVTASILESASKVNKIGAAITKKIKPQKLPSDSRFVSWDRFIRAGDGISNTVHNPDAPAVICYTGGTTGGSKGVMLSSKAVIAVAEQYITGSRSELSRNSTWVQVLPLFIAYGITCSLMIPLCVGMTMIVRIPMADTVAHLCKKFKPNHILYGPAYWEKFADENKNLDLSYLIAPITGGDTLKETTENKINAYLEKCGSPYQIMNGYGMTEVGAAVSVNCKDKYEFGSVGLPFVHNIVAAFNPDTFEELKYNQQGELCILTPSMMIGYFNNHPETEKILKIHKDGKVWVHTGDLGYISEEGFIHICGRIKRYMLCIENGIQKKVFALDIERILEKMPYVAKCVVVPIDDDIINQVPVAFVVLRSNLDNRTDLEQSIRAYSENNLQDVYRPRKYFFVNDFPLTNIGKVDYRALEKTAALNGNGY